MNLCNFKLFDRRLSVDGIGKFYQNWTNAEVTNVGVDKRRRHLT